ncbi:MAG: helix-turn-helix domain-containing protein [Alphaproteobacteria bacterium]
MTAAARRAEPVADAAPAASLGTSIREARHASGKTLREVADAAGVSISYLSQIERDLLTPAIGALRRIAEALGLPAGTLAFASGARPGRVGIVRRDARKRVSLGDGAIDWELLTPDVQGRVSVLALNVPPGAEGGEAFSHPGEDIVVVQRGTLSIEVGGLWHEIGPGDSMRFGSEIPHRWRNAGSEPVEALWISSPPWL